MKKIKLLFFISGFVLCLSLNAQRIDLRGQLVSTDEIEGIHILNKTALKYTISNEDGSFEIPAQVSDTLYISGLKYENKNVIVTNSMINSGRCTIQLVEKINQLDPVVVGTILTGSLQSDLENSDAETEINFYDLGIPGFTGKPLTLNERKLFDADAGPMGSIMGGPFGGGVGLNFHKLLNKISGRTKKLKKIVELDDRDRCAKRLRLEYEDIIFEEETLAQNLRTEYFMFCQEDEGFLAMCNENNDIKAIDYLRMKLRVYQKIRNSKTTD